MEEIVNSKGGQNVTKVTIIDEKEAINEVSKKDALNLGAKSIIEAKSVNLAERIRSLSFDNENINEKDLSNILGKEDQDFYKEKKDLYLEHYPDLADDPFDLDDLHSMIMEQIFQRNLMRKKKKHPFSDIEKEYESSRKRQNELKKSLSVRRVDRIKQKDNKKQQINIANLSVHFQDPERLKEFSERTMNLKQEEAESGLLDSSKTFE